MVVGREASRKAQDLLGMFSCGVGMVQVEGAAMG